MKKIILMLVICIFISSCNKNNFQTSGKASYLDDNTQKYDKKLNMLQDDNDILIENYNKEFGIGINSTNFPDKLLREYVIYYYDNDCNYYLSKEEIKEAYDFDLNQLYLDNENNIIHDLSGIELFTNLENFHTSLISKEALLNLDHFPNLKNIYLDKNTEIGYFDFSSNKLLKNIYIRCLSIDKLTLYGINSKININIENNSENIESPLIVDITNCDFFEKRVNSFENIIFYYSTGENIKPTKIIKDDEVIIYDSGIRKNEYVDINNNGIKYITGEYIYYFGKGSNTLIDNLVFDDYNKALVYGSNCDSCFRIQNIYYDDTPDVISLEDTSDIHMGFAVKLVNHPFNY